MKRDLDQLVLQMHNSGVSYTEAVREFKRSFLLQVLARHRGNQCKAAEELGMHRNTLSRTLTELDLNSSAIRQGLRRPVRPAHAPNHPSIGSSMPTGLQVVGQTKRQA